MTHKLLSRAAHDQDQSIYKTFPLIRKIAYKKLRHVRTDFVEDILQTVAMRLWKWRKNQSGRELSDEEWCKLANKVTHNEIRRFYRKQLSETVSYSILNGSEHRPDFIEHRFFASVEGNTDLEVCSILQIVWKNLSVYSLLEKYAYLLQNDDIPRLLLTHRCCKTSDLAECLGLTTEEILGLIRILPLSDKDIACFMGQKLSLEMTAKQILDARYRVRLRLHRALVESEAESRNNDRKSRTFVRRKTTATIKGAIEGR